MIEEEKAQQAGNAAKYKTGAKSRKRVAAAQNVNTEGDTTATQSTPTAGQQQNQSQVQPYVPAAPASSPSKYFIIQVTDPGICDWPNRSSMLTAGHEAVPCSIL